MGFSKNIKEDALVASARHCSVCHKWKGVKLEVHHINPKEQGGLDTAENAIVLCFDCHADAGHYFAKHPKGTKFTPKELKKHKKEWLEIVKKNKIQIPDQDISIKLPRMMTQPPTSTNKFLGRRDELKEIKEKLLESKRVIVINGMGGIGKTELTTKFIEVNEEEFDHIIWINYEGNLIDSFIANNISGFKIFEDEESKDTYKRLLTFIENFKETNSLLIIDKANNKNDIITNRGLISIFKNVIITSRFKIDKDHFTGIDLDFLSPEDCLKLFQKYCPRVREPFFLNRIIELAGYHTLTIELLSKTLEKRRSTTAEDFFNILVEKGFNLNKVINIKIDSNWDSENNQKKFFEHLTKVFDLADLTKREKWLLIQFSILPSEFIPFMNIYEWLQIKIDEQDDFNTLFDSLTEMGWLKKEDNNENYKLHQVIQDVILNNEENITDKCEDIISFFIKELHKKPKENSLLKSQYVIYAKTISEKVFPENNSIAALNLSLSIICLDLGKYEDALQFQLKALVIQEKILDKNHPDIATSYDNLAGVHQALGKFEDALQFQLESVAICEDYLNIDHPYLAREYSNLSSSYLDLGNNKDALKFQLKAISIREKTLDKDHPDFASSFSTLSLIYMHLGKFKVALQFQLKALAISERIFKNNHPFFATIYSGLSRIYIELGEYKDALKFQLKAVPIHERSLGKDHPKLATAFSDLSIIYLDLHKIKDALKFQLKAISIREKTLDKDHPDIAVSYNNLSMIHRALGNFEIALKFQLKSQVISEKKTDNVHPNVINSYNNLSMIYKDLKNYKDALKFQLKVISIRKKTLINDHPDFAVSYNNLSLIYLALGNLEDALSFQFKAVAIREAKLDNKHPHLANSYNNLSTIYHDLKKYELSEKYIEKAILINQYRFPDGHPDLSIMIKSLNYIRKLKDKI